MFVSNRGESLLFNFISSIQYDTILHTIQYQFPTESLLFNFISSRHMRSCNSSDSGIFLDGRQRWKVFTFFRKGTKGDIYKYITYMCILNRPKSLKTRLFFNRLHEHPPPQFCFTRAVCVAKENSLPDDSFSSSTSPSASTQPPFFLVARHLRLVYHWWW